MKHFEGEGMVITLNEGIKHFVVLIHTNINRNLFHIDIISQLFYNILLISCLYELIFIMSTNQHDKINALMKKFQRIYQLMGKMITSKDRPHNLHFPDFTIAFLATLYGPVSFKSLFGRLVFIHHPK